MKKLFVFLIGLIFALSNACESEEPLHPLSDEFIDLVNQKATTWKAGRNFHEKTSMKHLKRLMGALETPKYLRLPKLNEKIPDSFELPESFDARVKWPQCPSISEIRDQGNCGSCWAISSAEVMSDRECTISNGQKIFHYSTEDIISCCNKCGFGCNGGYSTLALRHWVNDGFVSGGEYNSSEGCYPYELPPCEHHANGSRPSCGGPDTPTPNCKQQCQPKYETDFKHDLRKGAQAYSIRGQENAMQELIKRGPIVSDFTVYEDFVNYKSGVYSHTHGKVLGAHAIRVLGYGVEDGVPYWLCANSWNTDWGDKGYFKILRGKDECGIEENMKAGIPQ